MAQFSTKGQDFPVMKTNLFGSFNVINVNDILSNAKDMAKKSNVEFLKLVFKFVLSGKTRQWYDYQGYKVEFIGNPAFYEGVDRTELTIRPTMMQGKADENQKWIAYSIGTINTGNNDEDEDDDDVDDFLAQYVTDAADADADEDDEEVEEAPKSKAKSKK